MQTSKKEVSKAAVLKAAHLKIAKLEKKMSTERDKSREIKKECRELRKKNKVLEAARTNWKSKAVERNKIIKSLKKRVLHLSLASPEGCPARHHYDLLIITLAVLLRVKCNCSYRSIPNILAVIFDILGNRTVKLSELPCSNTVSNWVHKAGYSELKNGVEKYENKEVCLILDESIRVGREKLLVGLVCEAENTKTQQLNFENTSVLLMEGRVSWKGEDIKEVVNQAIVDKNLKISYITSDEGNNLKSAIKQIGCPHIADISHAVANCLKREFSGLDAYQAFIGDVKKYQRKLVMGKNSFYRPKKQRAKARFMNQENLVDWAEIILEKWTSFSKEIQEIFKEMPRHRPIIERLRKAMNLVNSVSKLLINKGINKKSITQSLGIINKIEMDNSIQVVISELKKYINNYKEILENKLTEHQNIFGCSKVIERLFGIYKEKISTNYFNGITASCLELPLVCLPQETLKESIKSFIETVFMSNINDWKKKNKSDNQAIKRKEFFKR